MIPLSQGFRVIVEKTAMSFGMKKWIDELSATDLNRTCFTHSWKRDVKSHCKPEYKRTQMKTTVLSTTLKQQVFPETVFVGGCTEPSGNACVVGIFICRPSEKSDTRNMDSGLFFVKEASNASRTSAATLRKKGTHGYPLHAAQLKLMFRQNLARY